MGGSKVTIQLPPRKASKLVLCVVFLLVSLSVSANQNLSQSEPATVARELLSSSPVSAEYAAAKKTFEEWRTSDRKRFEEVESSIKASLKGLSGSSAAGGWIALLGVRDSDAPANAEKLLLVVTDKRIQIALVQALQYYHPLYPKSEIGEQVLFSDPEKMAFEVKVAALEALMTVKDDRAAAVCRRVLGSSSKAVTSNLKDYTRVALVTILNDQKKSLTPEELQLLLSSQSEELWVVDKAFRTWLLAFELYFGEHQNDKNNERIARLAGNQFAHIIRDYGEKIGPSDPVLLFESIQTLFSPAAQLAFEAAARETIVTPVAGEEACQVTCQLAYQVSEWAKPEYLLTPDKGYDDRNELGWRYALSSLSALFLAKAAPYCPRVEESSLSLVRTLRQVADVSTQPSVPQSTAEPDDVLLRLRTAGLASKEVEKFLSQFGKEADKVHPSTQPNYNPLNYYGNIFHALFLEEIVRNERWQNVRNAASESDFQEVVSRVYNDLSLFEHGLTSMNGSLWHTYLLGLSTVTTDNSGHSANRVALERLRKMREAWVDPCHFPYKPYENKSSAAYGFKDDTGAMIPRSVTANLALYLDRSPKPAEQVTKDRDSLMKSLQCFYEHGWKSSLQLSAENYHSNAPSRIGSHFLYPNLPYIVTAAKYLAKDPELTDSQRRELVKIDQFLGGFVLSLKKKDGLFRRMGNRNSFTTSTAHTYPFAGLALLQYCAAPEDNLAAVVPRSGLPLPATRRDDDPPSRAALAATN